MLQLFLERDFSIISLLDNECLPSILRLALHKKHISLIESILRINPEAALIPFRDRETLLDYALTNGHKKIVELIIALNPEAAFIPGINGKTPLDYAAINGHKEIVELIITLNPKAALIPDINGKRPLDYALINGHKEIVELILEAHAPLYFIKAFQDSKALDAMNLKGNRFNLVIPPKYILKNPKILSVKDEKGKTVVDYLNNPEDANMLNVGHQLLVARDAIESLGSVNYFMKNVCKIPFGVPSLLLNSMFKIPAHFAINY